MVTSKSYRIIITRMFPVITETCGEDSVFSNVEIKNWTVGIAHPFRTVKQISFEWHLL